METIANRGDLEGLTKEEAIIVRYGRELMDDHQVSQETFDAALAQFGEANTIVLGALMGYYSFISCTLLGTDMRPPEGSPVLPKRVIDRIGRVAQNIMIRVRCRLSCGCS